MPHARRTVRSSVHRALNAVGDRWSQLLVEAAFRGASRFEEFRQRTGASRNTLTGRLGTLVDSGVFERRAVRDGGAQQGYVLTPMGRSLFDTVLLAWSWGIRWDAVSPTGPSSLVHRTCGKPMLPAAVCDHCGGEISLHTCAYRPGPGTGYERVESPRLHRRRQPPSGRSRSALDVMDMTGDRWTGLVISSQFFGVHRFDDIHAMLEIATNILADRLRALVGSGVFERRLYQIAPPRYEYWLTKKGRDLYPHALSLLLWGDRWLADRSGPPVIVTHKPCGKPVRLRVICGECRGPLDSDNVTERPSTAAPARRTATG
jgi:DNA-binding HxlR family transcriptional regulator